MAERKDREESTRPIAWFDPFESPLNNERSKFCLYFPEVYERTSIELNHEYKRLYVLNFVDL